MAILILTSLLVSIGISTKQQKNHFFEGYLADWQCYNGHYPNVGFSMSAPKFSDGRISLCWCCRMFIDCGAGAHRAHRAYRSGDKSGGAPVVPPATLIVFFALRYLIYPLVIQGFANWNITISNLEQMLNLEHQHFKHFHRHFRWEITHHFYHVFLPWIPIRDNCVSHFFWRFQQCRESQSVAHFLRHTHYKKKNTWVCLKIGYIPNEIAI